MPSGATGIAFQPAYNVNNQFGELPGSPVSYNADGELLQDEAHTYIWDASGHLVKVDAIGMTVDALGRMVEAGFSWGDQEMVYGPEGRKVA
ncbi:MAG: hypothetical protein ACRD0Y_11685 [Terriglobales bacterium]